MKVIKSIMAMVVIMATMNQAYAESKAVFAGGCFWCMEKPFEEIKGVSAVVSGYVGGDSASAQYDKVASGTTQHREAVEISFDATKVSYQTLLDVFWKNIDPVDTQGQFCDQGFQYTTAIIAQNAEQKQQAEQSKKDWEARKGVFATVVTDKKTFYQAEPVHQNYYKTHPLKYSFYRKACGRDARLKSFWGE